MKATVISCQVREGVRQKTVEQLTALGLDVETFLSPCDPAGPAQNSQVAAAAFRAASSETFLFCEDDLSIAEDFPEYLAAALRSQQVVYFYCHDNARYIMEQRYGIEMTAAILAEEEVQRQIVPLREGWNLSNSQCILIPAWAHEYLNPNSFDGRPVPIDVLLWHTWYKRGYEPWVALPHPVQHLQCREGRKTGARPGKVSKSFGLPRRGEVKVWRPQV